METRAYAEEHALQFPIARFPDPEVQRLYRVGGVPLTVVLGARGEVIYSRFGSIESEAAEDSVVHAFYANGSERERLSRRVGPD